MTVQMDETFATALRGLLVEQVDATPTRRWRRGPSGRRILGAGAVLLACGGGGVAYAVGVFTTTPPGGLVVRHLAPSVTVTGTGTETVQLGPQPAGTNAIDLSFTCLTAGTFGFADGSETCDGRAAAGTSTGTGTAPVAPGQDSTTVTAAPGTRWRLIATYSHVSTSAWGVNASGQTYGQANHYGTPDLVAVQATNGRDGYAYADQLYGPAPMNPSQALTQQNAPPVGVTVYESDGKTPIGVFMTGPVGPIPTQTLGTVPRPPAATGTVTAGPPTAGQ